MSLPEHEIKAIIPAQAVAARVAELGREISARYAGEPLVVVCVLKGAFHFFSDLTRHLTCSPELDFIQLSSYGAGTSSSGRVVFRKDMDVSVEGKHVLVVEDIVVITSYSIHYTKLYDSLVMVQRTLKPS